MSIALPSVTEGGAVRASLIAWASGTPDARIRTHGQERGTGGA